MEKYKICPVCQEKNPPALLECQSCEADLTGVKITDEETERMLAENAADGVPVAGASSARLVRICECGGKNRPNMRSCAFCGEDISDIVPTPDDEDGDSRALQIILSSLDGKYAFEIAEDDVVVGREHAMSEYLRVKSYVGREQARLSVSDGEVFIENLGKTNLTFVNNEPVSEKTKLCDGDELGLGGKCIDGKRQDKAAYFLVRIGSCT